MALSDFSGPNRLDEWTADLDRRWPERHAMADEIVAACREQMPPERTLRVLELGVGNGFVAAQLADLGAIRYSGVDRSAEMLEFVSKRLADRAQCEQLQLADLSDAAWAHDLAGPFDVVYSLQSLHDVGHETELRQVYTSARGLLAANGLLLNADFVVPQAHDDPERPRRFSRERHIEFLQDAGFARVWSVAEHGDLGCMAARMQ